MEEITFLVIKLKLKSAFLSIGPSVWRLSKVRLIYKEFYAVFIANDVILVYGSELKNKSFAAFF